MDDAFTATDTDDAAQAMADWAEMAAELAFAGRPLGSRWVSWLDREDAA